MTALASSTDPATSHEAAAGVQVQTIESRILAALRRERVGMTTHELARKLDLSLVTVSPRMRPLVNKGFIRDSGLRIGTPSRIVWQALA